MKVLTFEQKIEVFGDFRPHLNLEGLPEATWEEEILTYLNLPNPLPLAWDHDRAVSNIRCHYKIDKFLRQALSDLHSIPEVWATINDFGGVYAFRLQRRSNSNISSHAWAMAIDLDVGDNPFGKMPKVHPTTVEIFHSNGFVWGGNFPIGRKDGMHFEFADLSKLT